LESGGYKIIAANQAALPLCQLRVISETAIDLRAQLGDEGRKFRPIEMQSSCEFADRSELLPTLVGSVRALLDKTVSYRSLVEAVRTGKAIAFVGSGLSLGLHYPTWGQLLQILVREANLDFSAEEIAKGGDRALAIVESCREKLRDEFYKIIQREFGEKNPGFLTVHTNILQIPFASFMTTNIDPCLEVAVEHIAETPRKINVQIWPEFSNSQVGSRDIFYLHGKVPRLNQTCKVERVRLSTNDYKEAYIDTAFISDLLKQAMMESYFLTFIGYGLREPAIKELLAAASKYRKTAAKQVEKYEVSMETDKTHFALMPNEAIQQQEVGELFERCQVEIIHFPVINGDFVELERLIDDLYKRTVIYPTPAIRRYDGSTYIDERGDLLSSLG
jgi:hypothetical protein